MLKIAAQPTGELIVRKAIGQPLLLTALGAASLLYTAFKHPPGNAPQPASKGRYVSVSKPKQNGVGADAAKPTAFPARSWWAILKRVASEFSADRVMTEAAAITFYALLSIFPALAATVSLYGLVADPQTIADQVQSLSGVIPGGGVGILSDQVHKLASAGNGALGFGLLLGVATSLWTANAAMKSLFDALNVVNEETESRGFVKLTAITLLFTLGAIIFVILAVTAIVVLPAVLNFVGLGNITELLLRISRWPLLLLAITVLLALIYRFGPSRSYAQWKWVTWGSAFAAVVWLLVSGAFSYYVSNFGSYDKTYGSLGAAVGFMTWIWISAIVVLMGAELNAEMELQTTHDTTAGPEQPVGKRGAVKADNVA